MSLSTTIAALIQRYLDPAHGAEPDYFQAIQLLVLEREKTDSPAHRQQWQAAIDRLYALVEQEIRTKQGPPSQPVSFGTSGWRGILGKDLFVHSVAMVTAAILQLYRDAETDGALREALGVGDFAEMQRRGCVVGFDNRFGGPILALSVCNVLAAQQVKIWYAGEATTGALSASVLMRRAAFSINLTPSHNPLQYGGFKYNAADAGPAAQILTDAITSNALRFIRDNKAPFIASDLDLQAPLSRIANLEYENALLSWQELLRRGKARHRLDYAGMLADFAASDNVVVCVDAVHGASRSYIKALLGHSGAERLLLLRDNPDPTFGGIAPEPSSSNLRLVQQALADRSEALKIGAVIDPDGDRIRFTDGQVELSMNEFGAMAYHFLHEVKGLRGMVAKTVATSNLANAIARQLDEQVFEPKVGFKEFKPVINEALVCFEESDGITVIGHTPEKDAFIGLILALDMALTLQKPLGSYLAEIEARFGRYYPKKDGVTVSTQGPDLLRRLAGLERYDVGACLQVGDSQRRIQEVIAIDGRKMILDNGSWIMIRPSGTEPKVRFYVEAREQAGTSALVETAKSLLAEIGLLP